MEFLFLEPVYRTDYAAQIEGATVKGISFTSTCKDKYEFVNEGDNGLVNHLVRNNGVTFEINQGL